MRVGHFHILADVDGNLVRARCAPAASLDKNVGAKNNKTKNDTK